MTTGIEKNRAKWTDFGRRAFRIGADVNKIAATKVPSFNQWIREGFEKESKKRLKSRTNAADMGIMTTKGASNMNANQAIEIAKSHIGSGTMVSSAQLCLADAVALQAKGDEDYSKRRALNSVAYSVGIFHSDYDRILQSMK